MIIERQFQTTKMLESRKEYSGQPRGVRITGYKSLTNCPKCGGEFMHDPSEDPQHDSYWTQYCLNCAQTFVVKVAQVEHLDKPEPLHVVEQQCIICGASYMVRSDRTDKLTCGRKKCVSKHMSNQNLRYRESVQVTISAGERND